VALFAFAAPAAASTQPITQQPDTTGMGYLAGSTLEISWTSWLGLPEGATLTLYEAHLSGTRALVSREVGWDLGQAGSAPVTIPSDGGPYFYYLAAHWNDGSGQVEYSDAYNAFYDGTPWWFTIETLPSVGTQPSGQSVQEGYTATFSASGDGTPPPTCQWRVNDGTGWSDIAGATDVSYTTPVTTMAMNGWLYEAVFTNSHGSAPSKPAMLTVEPVPSITQLPATSGLSYFAGSPLTISWTSHSLDPDASLTLYRAHHVGAALEAIAVASGLPQNGSTTITIPSELGSWFYYLYTSWYVTPTSMQGVYSDQYNSWFTVVAPQAVTISAPTVTPGTPRPKRAAVFTATVTPAAAADATAFTLHLFHWETRKVGRSRVAGWYEYPGVGLSATDLTLGRVSTAFSLPVRGDWKMHVESDVGSGYTAGLSADTFFSVR
jgi:hypothetical protein